MSQKPIYKYGMMIMPGCKTYELLTSTNPEDLSKAKRLAQYVHEATNCFYEPSKIAELRQKYSDVV
jgi:hypothetical protein